MKTAMKSRQERRPEGSEFRASHCSEGSLDDSFTISCAVCGNASPLLEWTSTEIHGPLPHGTYQCPVCSAAFRRQWNARKDYGRGGFECARVEAML